MPDISKAKAPSNERYRVIDYVQDKFFGLWDMDCKPPAMIATNEYWDGDSQTKGSANMERIATLLNRDWLSAKFAVDVIRKQSEDVLGPVIVNPDGQTVLTQTPEYPDLVPTVKATDSPNDYIAADIDRLTRARALVLEMQNPSALARTKQRTIMVHIDQTIRRLAQMQVAKTAVNPNGIPPLD